MIKKEGQKPDGAEGIKILGHREFVGGLWDEIGILQFEFLKNNGLTKNTCFLDIACGSLRAGVHIINYLHPKKYLGLDKEKELIRLGIEKELGSGVFKEKIPEFVVSKDFEFDKFSCIPDISMAQSLFTHLIPDDILLCLDKLYNFIHKGHVLYATFFEGTSDKNKSVSHSHDCFSYTYSEIQDFAKSIGWVPEYIGDWGHPRGQIMIRFKKT